MATQGHNSRIERAHLLEDPTLFNLILDERWEEAWNLVERDPAAPYNARVFKKSRSFPLHLLCQQVVFIDHQENPEFSDDDGMEHMQFSQEDCERNEEIYRLARFMIQQSHTIQTPIVQPTAQENGIVTLESHRSILTLTWDIRTPLFEVLGNSCDSTMIQILFEGALSSPGILEKLQTSTNDFGSTPLHVAVNEDCPFTTLRLIVQLLPGNRLTPDNDGDLPLHWALMWGLFPSSRRFRLLLDGCHESLLVRNNDGMLPLQIMENDLFMEWEKLGETEQWSLWVRLEAVLMVVARSAPIYKYSWSILHAIASGLSFIPTKFLRIALELNEGTTDYDRDGLIPFHVAISKPPEEESIDMFTNSVQLLITETTAGIPTCCGRLPLHLALESNQPDVVVSKLVGMAPETVSVVDPVTRFVPFQLAAIEDNNALTTVYRLLRMNPSLL